MGKFIAIATKDKEFMFKTSTMIKVPTKSAQRIVEALNKTRYKLSDNEVWHIYDNDYYYNSKITKEIRRYSPKQNIKVFAYYG